MKRTLLPLLLALAIPRLALPQERADLAGLETQFDRAVSRVSRPAGVLVFGLPGTRAFRISGLGVVFVLPPRALEVGRRDVRFFRQRHLRPGVAPVPEEELQVIEQQVIVYAGAAESTRREAERHAEAVERQIRIGLDQETQVQAGLQSPAAVKPEAPPPVGPHPAEAPPAPMPPPQAGPPWLVWLQERDEEDTRSPERVVEDVGAAVVQTLELHGARAAGIKPEDNLVVVVDFVSPEVPFAPPERLKTLVVRVQKQTLLDKARGRLTTDQLRKAMVVEVY